MKSTVLPVLFSTVLLALAAPVLAAPAVTLAEAGFSAGPGNDYDIARTLAVGSHVNVIWCGTHDNWCLVDFHNKRGWLPMAALSFKVPHAVTLGSEDSHTNGDAIAVTAGGKSGGESAAMATEVKSPGQTTLHFISNTITKINP